MTTTRIIGIDFGTSTTVMCVKDYLNGNPIGNIGDVIPILFDRNRRTVPTLVYERNDGESYSYLYGYDAALANETNDINRGTLYHNFKMFLVSDDNARKKKSEELTGMFFKFLYDTYVEQRSLLGNCDETITYVSYPAKWPEHIRNFMVNVAQCAGFQNVYGLDEPTAAIKVFVVHKLEELEKNNLVTEGEPINILMIDMGAGTTDLSLCEYEFGTNNPLKMLCTWPTVDNQSLFGGREVDMILGRYVAKYVRDSGYQEFKTDSSFYSKCRNWKESAVSPSLMNSDGVVRSCGFVTKYITSGKMSIDKPFPQINRSAFEMMMSEYLKQFPEMINNCIKTTRNLHPDFTDVHFVVLTGGHSRWYFVKNIIYGRLYDPKWNNRVMLPIVQGAESRVLQLDNPQETVARGLAYQHLSVIEVKPVAANNIWLIFNIGNEESSPLEVVHLGEELPIQKELESIISFKHTLSGTTTQITCTKLHGENLIHSIKDEKEVMLSSDAGTIVSDFFKKIPNLLGHNLTKNFKLKLIISMTENQMTSIHVTISRVEKSIPLPFLSKEENSVSFEV